MDLFTLRRHLCIICTMGLTWGEGVLDTVRTRLPSLPPSPPLLSTPLPHFPSHSPRGKYRDGAGLVSHSAPQAMRRTMRTERRVLTRIYLREDARTSVERPSSPITAEGWAIP